MKTFHNFIFGGRPLVKCYANDVIEAKHIYFFKFKECSRASLIRNSGQR